VARYISVDIENVGNETAVDVSWSIDIQGFFRDKFNSNDDGIIPIVNPDDPVSIQSTPITFGFGLVKITVQARTTAKQYNALLFGPFIKIL